MAVTDSPKTAGCLPPGAERGLTVSPNARLLAPGKRPWLDNRPLQQADPPAQITARCSSPSAGERRPTGRFGGSLHGLVDAPQAKRYLTASTRRARSDAPYLQVRGKDV
jgi:hypothetical protein